MKGAFARPSLSADGVWCLQGDPAEPDLMFTYSSQRAGLACPHLSGYWERFHESRQHHALETKRAATGMMFQLPDLEYDFLVEAPLQPPSD